ncbi:MAG: hypothetical protein ACLFT8_09005 [Desulfovermiculus sp.]
MSRYKQLALDQVRTYSGRTRASKVQSEAEARPLQAGMSMGQFLLSLPRIMKVQELFEIARAVVQARQQDKPVLAMLGGHVIKTGCAPVLADLMGQGFITHVAGNGSMAIHDTELELLGQTSEDVAAQLEDGSFGMAHEVAEALNAGAVQARQEELGLGEALGRLLCDMQAKKIQRSLVARAYLQHVPCTVHVALGTDIVHQHPSADGAAIGDATLRDFRILANTVSQLGDGGVVLNLGSAVIMPEVFLKTLAVARNLGYPVHGFTTANLDMIQHYRPTVNVVQRPVLGSGKGYALTGHHEIMIPLLAVSIYEQAE